MTIFSAVSTYTIPDGLLSPGTGYGISLEAGIDAGNSREIITELIISFSTAGE